MKKGHRNRWRGEKNRGREREDGMGKESETRGMVKKGLGGEGKGDRREGRRRRGRWQRWPTVSFYLSAPH